MLFGSAGLRLRHWISLMLSRTNAQNIVSEIRIFPLSSAAFLLRPNQFPFSATLFALLFFMTRGKQS
jgi:hypothetical protein